ncbi:SDR family NAD(P)-dependent oxidoreductase [Chloroflexota bacterium]
MRLEGKVAIITGSARGLGKAFALLFSMEGARITLCDIQDCTSVAREIEATGGQTLPLKVDISNESDTSEMAKKTIERFGKIDILVNNAAIVGGAQKSDFSKQFDHLPGEDWDKNLSVNVKGTYLCCKAVIPYMKIQGSGKIINIASTQGFYGSPLFLPYSVSKGAVITLTRGLARGLGAHNINVNAICPGLVMTEAVGEAFDKEKAKQVVESVQLIKKQVQPEDIAAAALFLASEDARMITGQSLMVNGGEYLN